MFEDGQIIQVWMYVFNQYMVVVKYQMLWSDGGSQLFIFVMDIVGSIFGGDVFKNDFQCSQVLVQRFYYVFYKVCFMIKNVDICMCYFIMYQQWYIDFFYVFKYWYDCVN